MMDSADQIITALKKQKSDVIITRYLRPDHPTPARLANPSFETAFELSVKAELLLGNNTGELDTTKLDIELLSEYGNPQLAKLTNAAVKATTERRFR